MLIVLSLVLYGYFDLTVDSTNVNVNFKYTVTTTFASGNSISDMQIIGYSLNGNNNSITYLDNSHPTATNQVSYSANTSSMRVYVQWVDGTSNETLNNYQDTLVAINHGQTAITATVTFEQLH